MIPKSTVCQFDSKLNQQNLNDAGNKQDDSFLISLSFLPLTCVEKNPNPNYKNELAEYSHVDEATKYMIQKPTVAQFQKKVRIPP